MRLNPEESLEWLREVELPMTVGAWARTWVKRCDLPALGDQPWPKGDIMAAVNRVFIEQEAQRIYGRMLALGDFP